MIELFLLITIIFIIISIYLITSNPIYNDNQYYDKFQKKFISNLILNNKLETPIIKKNKILIITYDDRSQLEYVKLHNENLNKYCKKWGFEYKYLDKCSHNTYWCKMHMVFKELQKNTYDYVMWMDSDTFIFNDKINLSDVLNKFSSDIFIGSDNSSRYDLTNAGVFIIKNTEIGKHFMNDCINSFNGECLKTDGKLKGLWAGTCYEQGIMNILIADKYYKHTTVLSNDIIFNFNKCNSNVFIMHLYASTSENRKKCFTVK
jgi:hypothetical protein